jgi:hypothetical protein
MPGRSTGRAESACVAPLGAQLVDPFLGVSGAESAQISVGHSQTPQLGKLFVGGVDVKRIIILGPHWLFLVGW